MSHPMESYATNETISVDVNHLNSLKKAQKDTVTVKEVVTTVTNPVLPPLAPVQAPTKSKSKKRKSSAAAGSASQCGSQGENTGRWTAEEHRLFLQGLEQHGKGWKKIASLIPSRTVVQIRTHAQKYFQKLAKARQNGEEGDVTMEGRGAASVNSENSIAFAQNVKRMKQVTGTKRKAIQSVVISAERQGKIISTSHSTSEKLQGTSFPFISPILTHFLPPSTSTDPTSLSSAALEDTLFRFLTPMFPTAAPIVALNQNDSMGIDASSGIQNEPSRTEGESSPNTVTNVPSFQTWTGSKDIPSWYANGADVDALLNVADTLDWLTDTGDLNEAYNDDSQIHMHEPLAKDFDGKCVIPTNTSVTTLPRVESNVDSIVPSLPGLFDGSHELSGSFANLSKNVMLSSHILNHSASIASMGGHLHVFDSQIEESDFVSTILDENNPRYFTEYSDYV